MPQSSKKKPYPAPLTVPPLSGEHTHTFIILHGRGSNAERFGRELLASANLAQRLPTVKFVFPTARKRRSTVLKRIPINQWFDNYSLDDPNERTHLQAEGLMETAEFLRGLVSQEASLFENKTGESGYRRIVLGGLSQGCAAGIFTLLGGFGETGEERVGAFFGMSGWLPFERQLGDILGSEASESEFQGLEHDDLLSGDMQSLGLQDFNGELEEENDDDEDDDESDSEGYETQSRIHESTVSDTESDPFAPAADEKDDLDPFQSETPTSRDMSKAQTARITDAINYIRDILNLSPISDFVSKDDGIVGETPAYKALQTPVFLGRGSVDHKVSVHLGKKMTRLLADQLQMNVTWKAYEGLGHWYRVSDEIDDVVKFVQENVDLG